MKIAAIGDALTLFYLELAGIKTAIKTDDPQEALKRIKGLTKLDNYGLIIISSKLFSQIRNEIKEFQERKRIPIISEIPDIKINEVK